MKGRSLSGYQRKRVWINDGLGRFTDVAQVVGASDTYDGRAVALADLGNRGVLDVIVANQRGPLLDLPATPSSPAGTGFSSSSKAPTQQSAARIGARVELHWNGRVQVQEVSGGHRLQRAEPAARALRARRRRPRSIAWSSAGRQASSRRSSIRRSTAASREGASMAV